MGSGHQPADQPRFAAAGAGPEASPKGHYTQLVVQPLGWYDEPLSVVLTGDEAPSRGERLFVGLQNARLYNGTERIDTRGELALAESA